MGYFSPGNSASTPARSASEARWRFGLVQRICALTWRTRQARSTSQSRFRAGAPGLNDCSRALLRLEAGDAEVILHGRLEADADRKQVQIGLGPAVDLLSGRQRRPAQQVDVVTQNGALAIFQGRQEGLRHPRTADGR